jgi:hypothetical protein
VGQELLDVNALRLKFHSRYQPITIPFDVENSNISDDVCCGERLTNFLQGSPIGGFGVVPEFETRD